METDVSMIFIFCLCTNQNHIFFTVNEPWHPEHTLSQDYDHFYDSSSAWSVFMLCWILCHLILQYSCQLYIKVYCACSIANIAAIFVGLDFLYGQNVKMRGNFFHNISSSCIVRFSHFLYSYPLWTIVVNMQISRYYMKKADLFKTAIYDRITNNIFLAATENAVINWILQFNNNGWKYTINFGWT